MRHVTSVLPVVCLIAALGIAPAARAEEAKAGDAKTPAPASREALLDPTKAAEKAPATFKAKFETSKGSFVVKVTREWAPLGADRFYNLVKIGYFDSVRFFRVVPNFVVQFGIHGEPSVSSAWKNAKLKDDGVKQSNKKGFLTFAMGGPNTRTTQVFINLQTNSALDTKGFSPFGEVVDGMDVVEKLNSEYAESLTQLQGKIYAEGNAFLAVQAPRLDFIKKASIVR